MNKSVYVLMLLLLLFSCFFIWQVIRTTPDDLTTPGEEESTSSEDEATIQPMQTEPGLFDTEGDALIHEAGEKIPIPARKKQEESEVVKKPYQISGRVVDKETSEPVGRFNVVLMSEDERTEDGYPVRKFRETLENPEGRFTVPVEEEGKYKLWVTAEGYLGQDDGIPIEISAEKTLPDLLIRMDQALSLSGIVLDGRLETPIEGAEVSCAFARSSWRDKDGKIVRRASYSGGETKTDHQGRFFLSDLRPGVYVITASHPRYTRSTADAAAGTESVEIRMNQGFKIFGQVRDDQGRLVQGIEIQYKGDETFKGGPYQSNSEGYYETDPLRPCQVRVIATAPKKTEGEPLEYTEEAYRVEVVDRDVELNFGPSPNHVTWKGTYFGWERRPVSGGKIRIWNDWIDNDLRDVLVESGASIHRRVTCDKEGRFEIRKLVPGLYRVDMGPPEERSLDFFGEREWIEFKDPGIVEMDLYLRRTEISGTLIDGGTGKPLKGTWAQVSASRRTENSNSEYYSQTVSKDGKFCFRGLPPGTYAIQASPSEYPAVLYGDVTLSENQIKDDLKIIIPASGKLRVKVTGLRQIEGTVIDLEIRHSDNSPAWTVGPGKFTKGGNWEIDFPHEVGSWILVLSDVNLGKVVRPYEIIPKETTDILVSAEEFTPSKE